MATADLVPLSWVPYSLLSLAGIAIWVGIVELQIHHQQLAARLAIETPMLDVTRPGSLGAWFSTTTLLALAAAGTMIYHLRSHRIDDYRGSYRLWAWLSLVWFVSSIDATTHFSVTIGGQVSALVDLPMSISPVGRAVVCCYGVPALYLGYLLARETVESRMAAALLGLATLCYGAHLIPAPIESVSVPLRSHVAAALPLLLVLGHWLVLSAVAFYARAIGREMAGIRPNASMRRTSQRKRFAAGEGNASKNDTAPNETVETAHLGHSGSDGNATSELATKSPTREQKSVRRKGRRPQEATERPARSTPFGWLMWGRKSTRANETDASESAERSDRRRKRKQQHVDSEAPPRVTETNLDDASATQPDDNPSSIPIDSATRDDHATQQSKSERRKARRHKRKLRQAA